MFSYTVQVRKIPRPMGKVVAFASLVIDEVLQIDGFRIVDGKDGLFMSAPQHKGKGKNEDGEVVEKYFDDVRFIGDNWKEIKEEVSKSVLEAYQTEDSNTSRASAAQSQSKVNESSTKGSSNRKALW
jgi:DNA-binding cell septation regulator SpoVG